MPTIAGEIKRHFRDRGWAIRPPRELQELVQRVDRAAVDLMSELNRAPIVAELAEAVGEMQISRILRQALDRLREVAEVDRGPAAIGGI